VIETSEFNLSSFCGSHYPPVFNCSGNAEGAQFTVFFSGGLDMRCNKFLVIGVILLLIGSLQACKRSSSPDNGTVSQTGTLSVLVTDAPGDFDHVFITVKDIWFHTSDSAGPNEAGWIKKPLSSPKTIDLLTLTNGTMQSLWSEVTLTVGDYQQIRLVLADSDDPLTASAAALNLSYNNEVKDNNVDYPLHIPDASHGILLVGHFTITDGGNLRLAIDFDADHDIVEFRHNEEYVLKPRLRYFDLDNAGAIIGTLSTGTTFTAAPRFVIKVEGLSDDGTYHVVKRWTVPNADGSFVLYPVSTATMSTYDVLVRGLDYRTVIIKGVPVIKGTTPTSGASNLGTISMMAATAADFVSNGSITSPTGAWVNFYQTLPGTGEVPYEIRFRHFLPLTGTFSAYPLSSEPILVGTYGTPPISLISTTPVEGAGIYQAVADAILYERSGWGNFVLTSSPTVTFSPLFVQSSWSANTISGNITMHNPNKMNGVMNNGIVFAVHGGMIVNAVDVDSQMATGGPYTMPNMPGGTPGDPHPLAFYGVEAIGWDSLTPRPHRAIAIPAIADLRTGDDTSVTMDMLPLW
jgi:hypothetical protein